MLAQHQGLFCSHAVLPESRQGVHHNLGGDTARTADPSWPKGCPTHNVMTHDNIISTKSCGKERKNKGGCLELPYLPSQVKVLRHGVLLSWQWLNIYLLMGSSELIPCSTLLVSTAFTLPVELPQSQLISFLTFTLQIFSPVPWWGEWESGCIVLSCLPRLNHNSYLHMFISSMSKSCSI